MDTNTPLGDPLLGGDVWFEDIDPRELDLALGVRPAPISPWQRLERFVALTAVLAFAVVTINLAGHDSQTSLQAASSESRPFADLTLVANWAPHADPPEQVLGILDTLTEQAEPMLSDWVPVRCAALETTFADAGLPAWMTLVAWRESRCDPTARNLDLRTSDDSWGLFQINTLGELWGEVQSTCGLTRPDELLDATVNTTCAARLYASYGYRPWDAGTYFN